MMRVAILKCDEVMVTLQEEFGSYPEMIQHMFTTIDGQFEFDCFDCQRGHYPKNFHDYDFYITTGSKSSVYDNKPWIEELIVFTQKLDRHKKKLIGICFGHQIIAMAFHQMVEKSDKGWGIGISVNQMMMVPDWMSEKRQELNILVSHQDQVVSLPEDAIVIAKSSFCPFFMVQWNDYFLSIQGHPEFLTAYSRALINERRAVIPHDRVESALESLTIEPDNGLFCQWVIDFVGS